MPDKLVMTIIKFELKVEREVDILTGRVELGGDVKVG